MSSHSNCKITMFFKIFLYITLLSVVKQVSSKKARIAIVGAGIGGSSCSFFLRDNLKDDIDIDIYEANEIGGRLAVVEHEGQIHELGGAVIHERNKYMNSFLNKYNLGIATGGADIQTLAIRGNDGYQFCTSQYSIITYVKAFWYYGFLSLYRMRQFCKKMLDKFDKIYKLQDAGKAYTTVEKLFSAIDPHFLQYFKISAKEGLRTYVHLNKKIIDELIKATIRVNYGQSTDVHMFLASISMVGGTFYGKMWGIKGGNKRVPESLIKESKANFLNYRVVKIAYDEQTKEYIVDCVSPSTKEEFSDRYDVVVIANPITGDSKTPIEFADFPSPISVPGRYQRIVSTIVAGNLNADYYRWYWYKGRLPDMIIENDDPIVNSVTKIGLALGVKKNQTPIFKVFSERPLKSSELNAMFRTPKIIKKRDWLAYPKYEKMNLWKRKFVLHDRLFYLNAIEWAASCMEMSVIGARNVAHLVEKELQSEGKEEEDEEEENEEEEKKVKDKTT